LQGTKVKHGLVDGIGGTAPEILEGSYKEKALRGVDHTYGSAPSADHALYQDVSMRKELWWPLQKSMSFLAIPL
jgi:hypothetical protein